jgi:hypothetical protein
MIEEVRESREDVQHTDSVKSTSRVEKQASKDTPFKLKPKGIDFRSKTPQADPRKSPEVPDYVKASPRWKQIESLNADLDTVSLNFL